MLLTSVVSTSSNWFLVCISVQGLIAVYKEVAHLTACTPIDCLLQLSHFAIFFMFEKNLCAFPPFWQGRGFNILQGLCASKFLNYCSVLWQGENVGLLPLTHCYSIF